MQEFERIMEMRHKRWELYPALPSTITSLLNQMDFVFSSHAKNMSGSNGLAKE
jgi:hypothetical protein